MNCWRIQTFLAPYVDGELPAAEQEAFEAHLTACEDCDGLVADVAAMPAMTPFSLPQEHCELVLEALSETIHARIAAAAPSIDEDGRDLLQEPPAARAGFFGFLTIGDLRISGVAAAAYVGVVLLLAAGIALNRQRVVELESSVVERDAIIDGMSARLASATPEDGRFLTPTGLEDAGIVIMPAGSFTAAGVTAPLQAPPLPADWQGAEVAPYLVSYGLPNDGPRVVH